MMADSLGADSTALLNAFPTPAVVLDGCAQVKAANRAFYDTFSLTADRIERHPLAAIPAAWNTAALRDLVSRVARGEAAGDSQAIVHAGGRGWCVRAARLDIADGGVLLTFEEARSEHDVKTAESSELLQTILDHMPAMVAMFDPAGRFTYINRAWEDTLGFTLDDIQTTDIFAHFFPDPKARQNVLDIIQRAEVKWNEATLITRADTAIDTAWSNVRLSDGRLIGIGINITERKRADAALRASEEHFRRLFAAGGVGMSLIDRDLRYVRVNPAFAALLGCDERELTGRSLVDFTHPDDVVMDALSTQRLFSGESASEQFEKRFLAADGRIIWGKVTATRFDDPPGEAQSILRIVEDVTERKRAEEENRALLVRAHVLAGFWQLLAEVKPEIIPVVDMIASAVSTLLGSACIICLVSDDHQYVTTLAVAHLRPGAAAQLRTMTAVPHVPFAGLRQVIASGQAALLSTTDETTLREVLQPHEQYMSYVERYGVDSLLLVPLHHHGRVIGTMTLTRDHGGEPFTLADQTFAQAIADHAGLAIQNARLFEEVLARRERMRQLAQDVLNAQEMERKRISRELHDEAGQALTALKINLELLGDDLPPTLPALKAQVRDMMRLTDMTVEQIRLLARDLRPPALDTVGVRATIEGYCRAFSSRTQLPIYFSSPPIDTVGDAESICLYRCLQEGLTNVAKHADATAARVSLGFDRRELCLDIEDDGRGMDAPKPGEQAKGIGLLGIQERLELLGGRLTIYSAPGRGTVLRACLPVSGDSAR